MSSEMFPLYHLARVEKESMLSVAGSIAGVSKNESANNMQLSEGPHTGVRMRP